VRARTSDAAGSEVLAEARNMVCSSSVGSLSRSDGLTRRRRFELRPAAALLVRFAGCRMREEVENGVGERDFPDWSVSGGDG